MQKLNYIFIVLIVVLTTTAYSQTTDITDRSNRTKQDSATYSWEQVNEIANGLVNEQKLDSAYQGLRRETDILFRAFHIQEQRITNFEDTIIPAYKGIIKEQTTDINDLHELVGTAEKAFKLERKKRIIWGIGGTVIGTLIGIMLGVSL